MLKFNRKKDFASFISQTLIARSLDSDDKTWEESEDFKNFVISSEQLDVFSLECIDAQNKVHVLCVVKVCSEINNDIIVEKINKQLINKKYIKLTFLWIVNSLRDKLCLKKQQSTINRKLKVGEKIEAPCYFIFKETGDVDARTRKELALEAFTHTAEYDAMISDYLKKVLAE